MHGGLGAIAWCGAIVCRCDVPQRLPPIRADLSGLRSGRGRACTEDARHVQQAPAESRKLLAQLLRELGARATRGSRELGCVRHHVLELIEETAHQGCRRPNFTLCRRASSRAEGHRSRTMVERSGHGRVTPIHTCPRRCRKANDDRLFTEVPSPPSAKNCSCCFRGTRYRRPAPLCHRPDRRLRLPQSSADPPRMPRSSPPRARRTSSTRLVSSADHACSAVVRQPPSQSPSSCF